MLGPPAVSAQVLQKKAVSMGTDWVASSASRAAGMCVLVATHGASRTPARSSACSGGSAPAEAPVDLLAVL